MADYVTDGKIGIDLTAIYASTSAGSAATFPAMPGDHVTGSNNSEYVFARASSTVAAYDCVVFSALAQSASATPTIGCVPLLTANVAPGATAGGGSIGIAQVAITSAYYGWVAIRGSRLRVNTLIACNPNVPLYTTSTGGSLDDTTVSAGYVTGITINSSAVSASSMLCVAAWPKVIVLGAG
jgi:hypothetical protein